MTTPMTFVRWKRGESRRCKVTPELSADHPFYTALCLLCERQLGNGQPVQLVAVGPVSLSNDDEDEVSNQDKYAQGRWFSAGAVVLHQACVEVTDDDDLGMFCAQLVPEYHDGDDDE